MYSAVTTLVERGVDMYPQSRVTVELLCRSLSLNPRGNEHLPGDQFRIRFGSRRRRKHSVIVFMVAEPVTTGSTVLSSST